MAQSEDKYVLDDVLVVCPHCGGRARYRARTRNGVPLFYCSKAMFRCDNCFRPLTRDWYGSALAWPRDARCGYCGTPWPPVPHAVKDAQKSITLTCRECGNIATLEAFHVRPYHGQSAMHGLHWWLKTSVGQREIWAFSYTHLRFLKDFIAAPIRSQTPCAAYFDYVLPGWIKEGRYRNRVLKALDRMALR